MADSGSNPQWTFAEYENLSSMKVYFLGTNGWFTTPTGNTPCILIDSKEGYIIFDAGNGIYKIKDYIKENKPISLFISHFHLDHVSGIHSKVLGTIFPSPINIYFGKGRKNDFDVLSNAPYTNPKNSIKTFELEEGKHDIGFLVEVFKMRHTNENHGYRVTLEGKTIAYSGDTGICSNSIPLAQDVDLLIHECSFIKAPEPETWDHVDPYLAANLAKEANSKQLILTHFDASLYTDLDKRKWAEQEAKKIFPNTQAAVDDLSIEL